MSDVLREQLELLPGHLAAHLRLSLAALAIGVVLSLALSFLSMRVRGLRGPLLAVASTLQTIPALALLALMVPLLSGLGLASLGVRSIGFAPALVALVLYSMLPVVRNAVTGLEEVDANLIRAGTGLGMTEGQLLWRVRAPLALPVIVAGIRTATVWVVGMATLSTAVGATSLGNYIFSGLQTQNHTAVLVGCVAVAALALTLDFLIRGIELAVRRRSRALGLGATAGLVLLALVGTAPAWSGRGAGADVRIGGKTFTEQYVLGHLLSGQLAARGLAAERVESLGSSVVFDALVAGDLDCYVDYTGTIWANYMQRDDNPGSAHVLDEVSRWLADEKGVHCLGPLGFENAYALAMRGDHARELGVRTIADLQRVAPRLSMGGDYEFFQRPEWASVRDAYGLAFAEERSFDPALMVSALVQEEVDVISAFSTDGRIAAHGFLVLEDPREALPPYDAVLLLSRAAAGRPEVLAALEPLVGAIDDEAMRSANMWVDVEGEGVAAAARRLAERVGAGVGDGH